MNSSMFRVACGVLVVGVIAVGLPGCGGDEELPPTDAKVSGKVTFQGKPVAGMQVCFYSGNLGIMVQAPLSDAGEFSLPEDIRPGDYPVYLIAGDGGTRGIPEKYFSETSSDVVVTVNAGENNLTIELKP